MRPTLDKEQHHEVEAGEAVGQEGSQTSARSAHIEAPGHDEDGVQDNIEETAAHGADTGVHGSTLGTHHIGHDDIEDRRGSAAGDGHQNNIGLGGGPGGGIRAQQGPAGGP